MRSGAVISQRTWPRTSPAGPAPGLVAAPDAHPAAGTAGLLDDLMHPLVAQAQVGGQLAQGRAVQVQPPHGPVELGSRHLHVALGIDQPLLGLPGLGQQLIVHFVYCS